MKHIPLRLRSASHLQGLIDAAAKGVVRRTFSSTLDRLVDDGPHVCAVNALPLKIKVPPLVAGTT